MYRIILLLTILVTSIFVRGQEKIQFLEVDYELEMVLDIDKVLANVPPAWKSQIEEPLRQEIRKGVFIDYKLHTNGTESVYKLQEKINNDQSPAGIILQQITATDKEPLYKNLVEQFYLKPYDFGRAYLVKDDLADFKWKISKEKTNIAGFDALKATGYLNDSIQVTAWYTPKINIKDGPDRFWGLPGFILKAEFEMMDIGFIITAKKVAVLENEIKIQKPTKGKQMSEKEFNEEMKALQEQMKEMYGGGVDTE